MTHCRSLRRYSKIDVGGVKARIDLLDLIGGDVQLKRAASTNGGEYAGACPFCGGKDRLRVQPERGLWWCRQCSPDGRWQDAIGYVMRRDRLDFREACEALGGGDLSTRAAPITLPAEPPDPEPTPKWREAAGRVVNESETLLWSDQGAKARSWLNARGLTDETIRHWRLGYNPKPWRVFDGAGSLERGITIPWFADGQLWHVNLRRPVGDPKYRALAGGHPSLFGADQLVGRRVAVLTEGEFDAMLLTQEAGSVAGVATLGSANRGLTTRAIRSCLPFPVILIVYDQDAAGRSGSDRLAALSARVRLANREDWPEGANDVTDAWRSGLDLQGWLAYNVTLQKYAAR